MTDIKQEFKKFLPRFQENVVLKNYSTFHIGGTARYFLKAENETELKLAIQKALDLNIDFRILGGGSNTLINSQGFNGLVIIYKNNPQPKDFMPVKINEDYFVEAEADWPLHFLVNESAEAGFSGLEWAVGIPGSVGGAINGNAGAFGIAIGDILETINVLEIKNGIVFENVYNKQDCEFEYRKSIFKNNKNLIILSAKIILKRSKPEDIKNKIAENLARRQNHIPTGFSIGSIFRNYTGEIDLEKHPELKDFVDRGAIPAGYLIEQCGLKGKVIGGAKISDKHANFIINTGKANSKDVLELINLIKNEVRKKFNIELEEEIKFI